jgi:hypothetical protein
MPYSDWLEQQILNYAFRGVAWTPPATWYAALFTVAPTDSGGGTEVTGGSYARVAITSNTSNWNAPTTNGLIDNTSPVSFPTATANWGDVVAVALFTASSGGNMGPYKVITATTVNNGQTASLGNGNLDVTLD